MAGKGPGSWNATAGVVDLRSDTVTRPVPAMRRAMAEAEVGGFGDDPTVARLVAVASERLGFEGALFVPSGTMANQVAIRSLTRPGERALVEAFAHVRVYEAGAPAVISGLLLEAIPAARGILDPADVERAIPPEDVHLAPASLICVENTSNRGGGTVYPLATLRELVALARRRGLAIHLDGARIFNASVASGVPVDQIARGFDTVSFCLSKGLGAPVGSLLCGSRDVLRLARRVRKMLGGGMRQSGILAAAGLYALEHHVQRLAEDHARARRLWEALAEAGFQAQEPETNMVYVQLEGAERASEDLQDRGILVSALARDRLRLVTHLDVDDAGLERAILAFREIAPG